MAMMFMMRDQKLMTTDAHGRVRVPVERREALLDESERSGVSGVKFAQMVGVKYPTFALWVQKRRKARKLQAGAAQAVTFAEAVVDRGGGVLIGAAGSRQRSRPECGFAVWRKPRVVARKLARLLNAAAFILRTAFRQAVSLRSARG